MNAPVSVMETAGEGGAWGIALLASYMRCRQEARPWTLTWPTRFLPGIREPEWSL